MTIRIADITGTKEFKINAKKAQDIAENVARRAFTELFSNIIVSTPVDTGRLRGNWQISESFGSDETGIRDRGGRTTIARVKGFLNGYDMKGPIAFFNNVPYAVRIEQGHSKQAPVGMVAVNVANFGSIVNKAIQREGDK